MKAIHHASKDFSIRFLFFTLATPTSARAVPTSARANVDGTRYSGMDLNSINSRGA